MPGDIDTFRRHLEKLIGARSWWELAVLGVEPRDHPAHIAGTVHLAVSTALRPNGDGWDVIAKCPRRCHRHVRRLDPAAHTRGR